MTDRQPPIARREAAADPYAWLENRDAEEVLDYLKAENAYLDEQLHPEDIDDSDLHARLDAQHFRLLHAQLPVLYARKNARRWGEQSLAYRELFAATWLRALYSRCQLFEVLVDHWHNYFNVYGPMLPGVLVFPDHDRRIRRNVFGNFRLFLEDIATSPAMLWYLENNTSTAYQPNEHFARELIELHTLGTAIPAGTERHAQDEPEGCQFDIGEVARCFTGWTVRDRAWDPEMGGTGEFVYRHDWHDRFAKHVGREWIGQDQPPLKDGRDVLDRLARHPATARNVATRLARRLVSDWPPDAIIQAGSDAYLANLDAPDQLRRVTQAIISHPGFWATWGEKVKRPFEIIAATLRATQAEWSSNESFAWYTGSTGQKLWEWGPPTGYPDFKEAWLSSHQILRRWSFQKALLEGRVKGTTVDLAAQTPAAETTPHGLAGWWAERLLGYRPGDVDIASWARLAIPNRAIDSVLTPAERRQCVLGLAALILQSPLAQRR